jgi:hypothetical protein
MIRVARMIGMRSRRIIAGSPSETTSSMLRGFIAMMNASSASPPPEQKKGIS